MGFALGVAASMAAPTQASGEAWTRSDVSRLLRAVERVASAVEKCK